MNGLVLCALAAAAAQKNAKKSNNRRATTYRYLFIYLLIYLKPNGVINYKILLTYAPQKANIKSFNENDRKIVMKRKKKELHSRIFCT